MRWHVRARWERVSLNILLNVEANSSQMLPTDSLSTLMMYPVDSLYRFLGARPASRMTPMRYLQLLERRDSVPNPAVADYQLCGYLIDRQLDKFASEIERYYTINDSLPRHYREALTLYTHLRNIRNYLSARGK